MKDEELRAQINALIRDEIQEGINDYIDTKEESEKSGLGFVDNKDEELKVNVSNAEVDKLIKEYKKIKKRQKSYLNQIRLLDKFGNPIKKPRKSKNCVTKYTITCLYSVGMLTYLYVHPNDRTHTTGITPR